MDATIQAQIAIRRRKLGVLIRDARLVQRKNLLECARAVGVSSSVFRAFEEGRKSPSLPELEVIAYYFNLPIQHFWSKDVMSDDGPRTDPLDLSKLASVRQRMVGALLRQKRIEADISLKALSGETGISSGRLKVYELGEKPIPLPELEACLQVLGARIDSFFDQSGPVGQWMTQQLAVQEFLKLPPDMQSFVSQPVNRPYLDLARNLSQLSTDKLRSVAEGLLDITL
jgi:transcriptional regulator with XRE-family HTH domain